MTDWTTNALLRENQALHALIASLRRDLFVHRLCFFVVVALWVVLAVAYWGVTR